MGLSNSKCGNLELAAPLMKLVQEGIGKSGDSAVENATFLCLLENPFPSVGRFQDEAADGTNVVSGRKMINFVAEPL